MDGSLLPPSHQTGPGGPLAAAEARRLESGVWQLGDREEEIHEGERI